MPSLQPSQPEKNEKKVLVESLKSEWKLMWTERYDDKTRAEGVSSENYTHLKVDRGTIIHATRDYKALDFREVLEQNNVKDTDRFVQPHKETGGWTKFANKDIIPYTPKSQRLAVKRQIEKEAKNKSKQQPKKGGRGWLHSK